MTEMENYFHLNFLSSVTCQMLNIYTYRNYYIIPKIILRHIRAIGDYIFHYYK